jgi:hypothetical protein
VGKMLLLRVLQQQQLCKLLLVRLLQQGGSLQQQVGFLQEAVATQSVPAVPVSADVAEHAAVGRFAAD